MYWYFCTLRAPVQTPDVVRITVMLVEKYKIEGLLAYILAHLVSSAFMGGHSVVQPERLRMLGHVYRTKDVSIPLPNFPAVLEFAVRCRKFLTTKTCPSMHTTKSVNNWRLDRHLLHGVVEPTPWELEINFEAENKFDIRFKVPEETTVENFHTFSVTDRKLRQEEIKV